MTFQKGNNSGRKFTSEMQKGRKLSEKTKEKMSEWHKNHPLKHIFKKGQHPSPKTEFKIGNQFGFKIGNSLGFKIGNQLGRKFTKERRAEIIVPVKDTKIEVKIQEFLKQLNIDFFTHHYIKEIEHGYQCDILIPSLKMVIECDGNYWHKYPIGKEIDHIRTKELLENGFKVLRLWENEINEMSIEKFQEHIRSC